MNALEKTAAELVAPGKGILAADESGGTIKKRFDSIGIESTEANRRAYRDMLFTTPCAEAEIVPIVEPEVLMDGDHDIERCYRVTIQTLHEVFDQLHDQHVRLEEMLLKPNMVISGKKGTTQAPAAQVAARTVACFREV